MCSVGEALETCLGTPALDYMEGMGWGYDLYLFTCRYSGAASTAVTSS